MSDSPIFAESSTPHLLRKFSLQADELAVNAVGVKLSRGSAMIFMLNSLTGLSLLTLPYCFVQSGLLLGSVTLLGCMAMSFITATFMCEALTIANAFSYERAEANALEEQGPELRQHLHEQLLDRRLSALSNPGLDTPLMKRRNTIEAFIGEIRHTNSKSAFKIRERVELGAMGELLLQGSKTQKWMATGIYLMILSFTYGTAAALVVTVNQSLAHTMVSVAEQMGNESFSADTSYLACVVLTFFVTLPLCFTNLQKTKHFTFVVMCLRFVAVVVLLAVSINRSVQRVKQEGWSVIEGIPMWRPEGFVAVFGNGVFLCGIHHYLPSMISPLEEQDAAPAIIGGAFLCCFCLIVSVCATALVAWTNEPHQACSHSPGGHFCQIQPLYNLNFAPLSWAHGAVATFLVAYPSMAIASIPIAVITTRNTMEQWLGIVPPDPNKPYTLSNVSLTLAVLLPPFCVALVTRNVQAVVQYVGGYAGLSVSLLCSTILICYSRRALDLESGPASLQRPLKSGFANNWGYSAVLLCYAYALFIVTRRLFF